jgi:glutathione S-transferase
MLRLYDSDTSGNSYKIRLLLAHLDRPYERIPVDVLGDMPDEVIENNPAGRSPMLVLDDGRCLPESNAILFYLADGTPYLSGNPYRRAQTLQWMFFEQNLHEPTVAVARFIRHHLAPDHPRWTIMPQVMAGGQSALEALERGLFGHTFLVDDTLSIADFALYAYTHTAHEGGFDLEPFPQIRAWLARVAAHPKHVPQFPN